MTRVLAAACATATAIALGVAAGATTAAGGATSAAVAAAQPDACSRLLDLSLPDTTITGAEVVAPGAFTPPTGGERPPRHSSAPTPSCRRSAACRPR